MSSSYKSKLKIQRLPVGSPGRKPKSAGRHQSRQIKVYFENVLNLSPGRAEKRGVLGV